jgi:hypothetical protein
MPAQETIVEMIEYLLVLVLPDSHKLLAISDLDGYRLPSISIPQWTRPAQQLQKAIRATWRLHVLVLDFFQDSPLCATAEVLVPSETTDLRPVLLEQLRFFEFSGQQVERLASLLAGISHANSASSQLGWIDDAITWLESETGEKLISKSAIEQYNAGGGSALVQFHMEDHRDYWLKATGGPNAHEFSITSFLSKLCGDYLPEIVSSRSAWNAWLMSGEAGGVVEIPREPSALFRLLEDAVECMAQLQMRVQGRTLALLHAGAFNQGTRIFQEHSAELFDYLEEAMSLQTSTKAPRLERKRLQDIRTIFEEVCQRMESLGIDESVVHGDLNHGNILIGAGHCQFIDWSEAYLGNPLISLQHLLLLNKVENPEIRDFINSALQKRYLDVWTDSCDPDAFCEGFLYMPMLAIASTLYGRGDWLSSPERNDPHRHSYTRSLVRHMDYAARESRLLEALCH